MKSEMDLFLLPLALKQIQSSNYVWYQSRAPVVNSEVIEIVIEPVPGQYVDLSKAKLHVTGKFVNVDDPNTPLLPGMKFWPVNTFMHALFKQVDVFFNDKQVTHGSQTYPYKAYLEILLNFDKQAKSNALQTGGYFEDDKHMMDIADIDLYIDGDMTSINTRHEMVIGSKTVHLSDKLHIDVFNIDKYIIGNTKISLKLTRSPTEFYTMRPPRYTSQFAVPAVPQKPEVVADAANGIVAEPPVIGVAAIPAVTQPMPNIKFIIQDVQLKVLKVKPVNNVFAAHNAMLLKTPAKYTINNVETKIINLAAGTRTQSIDNIFLGNIPTRLIVVMVDVRAFEGDYTLNPFKFMDNNISFLALYKDGMQHPSKPYELNFRDFQFMDCYEDFLECLDMWGSNKSNNIDIAKYKRGFTIFAWDLSPDLTSSSNNFQVPQQGTLRIDMKFRENLVQNLNLIVYGECKNIMEIGLDGSVALDYVV